MDTYRIRATISDAAPAVREAAWRWLAGAMGMPALLATPPRASADTAVPPARLTGAQRDGLVALLGLSGLRLDDAARAAHAAGRGLAGQLRLRGGDLSQAPDAVLYPYGEQDVLAVLRLCAEHGITVVPRGAGPGVTLDLSRMDRVTTIDLTSGLAHVEGGITGAELERHLTARGMTLDDSPDVFDFATLGGRIVRGGACAWLRGVRLATPQGLLITDAAAEPDLTGLARGAFGIVTGAVLRLKAMPAQTDIRRYLFADFASGIAAIREAARAGIPVSLRLSDDGETRLLEKLRQGDGNLRARFFEIYRAVRRFDGNAALLAAGFSGSEAGIKAAQKRFDALAKRLGALALGPGAWPQPVMALQGTLLDRGLGIDGIEAAVPWGTLPGLYVAVRAALKQAMRTHVPRAGAHGLVLCHAGKARSDGATLHFTWLFPRTLENDIAQAQAVRRAALDAIAGQGATDTALAQDLLYGIRRCLDPKNTLNPGKPV